MKKANKDIQEKSKEEKLIQNALGTLSKEEQFLLRVEQEIKKIKMPNLSSPNILKWYQKLDKELVKVDKIWEEIFEDSEDDVIYFGVELSDNYDDQDIGFCQLGGDERPDIIEKIFKQIGIYPLFLLFAAYYIWSNYRLVSDRFANNIKFEELTINKEGQK